MRQDSREVAVKTLRQLADALEAGDGDFVAIHSEFSFGRMEPRRTEFFITVEGDHLIPEEMYAGRRPRDNLPADAEVDQ